MGLPKHLAKATRLVNTRGSTNQAGPAQSKLPCPVELNKVPVVYMRNMLGRTVWVSPRAKVNPSKGFLLLKDLGVLGGCCERMGKSDVYLMGI